MKGKDELVRIFVGSAVEVNHIQAELEAHGISALIKNDFQSGLAAGFVGGTPSAIDLFVAESDAEKARGIIKMLDER